MNSSNTKNGDNKVNIMGVWVTSTTLKQVLEKIDQQVESSSKEPLFVVTAYSESLLQTDPEFKAVLGKASMVVADGVSITAAADYLQNHISPVRVAYNILSGKYSSRPSGVKIFKSILQSSKHRIYLTGGFNNVAERLVQKYDNIVGWDNGDRDIKKINAAKPDILFVALGRFKQETWISKNLDKLNVKVVIGVGSAFDEVANNWPVPAWVDRMGLKWLWRVTRDPKHITRAFTAFPVFPLRLYLWKNDHS